MNCDVVLDRENFSKIDDYHFMHTGNVENKFKFLVKFSIRRPPYFDFKSFPGSKRVSLAY